MATLSKPVGYACEFTDQVPEDYFCKLCTHVAREPTITSCCTEVLCKACINAIVQGKKPCPSCEDVEIEIQGPHKKYTSKILALQVCCTMKDRGCPWTVQLHHLNAHLDVTTGDCEYADVECPKKCVQKYRNAMWTHTLLTSAQIETTDVHTAIMHFDVCRYYPLACPNRCGVTFERDDLDNHMNMCRLEEVECVFAKAGCQANFIRENEDTHMNQSTQKHLALMPAAILKISQDFEQTLREQQEKFVRKLELKDEQIKRVEQKLQDKQKVFEKKLAEKVEQVKQVEQKLEKQGHEFEEQLGGQQIEFQKQLQQRDDQIKQNVKEKDEQIEELQQQIERISQQMLPMVNKIRSLTNYRGNCVPPYDILCANYQKLKEWDSTSIYTCTHPGGYRFVLKLLPDGFNGNVTHLTVTVHSLKSDHDAELRVPVKFTITIQLLNQHRDQDHHTRDIQCDVKKGDIKQQLRIGADWTSIPFTALEWNRDKQTQYLKNDCLRFRITKIIVQ